MDKKQAARLPEMVLWLAENPYWRGLLCGPEGVSS